MKKLTLPFCIFLFSVFSVRSQGCIIVRNISGFSHYNFKDYAYTSSNWVMDITGRYFKSYKDYKGGTNLNVPKADRSINYVFTTDFTITKFLKDGWGLSLNIPIPPIEGQRPMNTVERENLGTKHNHLVWAMPVLQSINGCLGQK